MGKGVLLELAGRQAVVLTPQGEFKRVPLPKGAWDIGDEVEFAETQPATWTRWGAVAAAAVVLLLAPVGYNVYADAQPQAIVTVDINPSLQLTLNRKDVVLKAEALNGDGELVLTGVEWERHPVGEVLAAVTTRAVEVQKLDPQSETAAVVVAVAPAKAEDLPKEQADRIRDKAYDAVTPVAGKASVAALEATSSEKAEAEAAGLNVGKFLLYKGMEQRGLQVKPEELQQQGPGKVLKGLGVNPGDIFPEVEKEHGGQPAGKSHGNGNSGSQTTPPAVPTSGQPGKSGNTDTKGNQKDDKGNNKTDVQKGPAQPGNSQSNGKDDKHSGQSDDNKSGGQGNGKSNGQSDKQSDSKDDQKNEHKGNGSDKGNEKKSSWTVPFLGITVENPFAPRATEPGVDGSDDSSQKVDEKQNEQREEKDSSGQKDQEEKSSNGKGEDKSSGGSGNGNGGNGNSKGSGNGNGNGSGNGNGKGKGKP